MKTAALTLTLTLTLTGCQENLGASVAGLDSLAVALVSPPSDQRGSEA